MARTAAPASRFIPRPDYGSRRSADLAGRAVALSGDIPTIFDAPLARHHRLVGSWVAACTPTATTFTRPQVRRHIERVFAAAVRDILHPVDLADLRVTVLGGDDVLLPAFVVTCDSVGQLDLGWIEDSNAPISWRAAAYAAVEAMLGRVLPVFGYQDLFDEIACYYWDGATDDDAAREALIACHGAGEEDLEHQPLPSTMNARRPAWMIGENASPSADFPVALRQLLDGVRQRHDALADVPPDNDAWHVDFEIVRDRLPTLDECSHLPPLTLVPVEQFACEVDDVGRHGMEAGFMDVAGFYLLNDADRIDGWFASLRLGARFLCAVQDLLRFDPSSA